MEISGYLFAKLTLTEGEGAKGHWVKGQFVLERDNEYRTKVAFVTFSAEVIEMLKPLETGAWVSASFSMESREFNGRWYSDLRCYRVDLAAKEPVANVPPQPTMTMPEQPMPYNPLAVNEELPF